MSIAVLGAGAFGTALALSLAREGHEICIWARDAATVDAINSDRLAPRLPMRHVWILAALLLVTGIPVQLGSWALLPVWYHLAFLIALVPMTVLGGRWQVARARA